MEKQEALTSLRMFELGVISLASAHLGFEIAPDGGLTESQAKKFHKFVKPLLVTAHNRVKGNEEKTAELQSVYLNTMPAELLVYLLKEQFIFESEKVKVTNEEN